MTSTQRAPASSLGLVATGGFIGKCYKRNGTTTLFAAFNVLDAQVIGQCQQRQLTGSG